jgi:hypothetical protein
MTVMALPRLESYKHRSISDSISTVLLKGDHRNFHIAGNRSAISIPTARSPTPKIYNTLGCSLELIFDEAGLASTWANLQ